MRAAYLIVRATVADPADWVPFDAWYQNEHLPDAVKAFGAVAAMRGWSALNPAEHTAFYRFPSKEAAEAASGGDAIKALVAEFDRCWPKVTRTRDIVEIADQVGSALA